MIKHILETASSGRITEDQAADMVSVVQSQGANAHFQRCYTEVFDFNDPYLRDHLVNGDRVLLGVTYCAIAVNAYHRVFGWETLSGLEKVSLANPVVLKTGQSAVINVDIGDGFKFVCYVIAENGEPVTVAEGRYVIGNKNSTNASRFDEVEFAAAETISGEGVYDAIKAVTYGPSLRSVKEFIQQSDQLTSRLEISQELTPLTQKYLFNPALLDGALITVLSASILQDASHTYIPIFIERMDLYSTTSDTGWCRGAIRFKNDEIIKSDFSIYGPEGQLIVDVSGFTCKRIAATSNKVPAAQSTDTSRASTNRKHIMEHSDNTNTLVSLVGNFLESKVKALLDTPTHAVHHSVNFMELGVESNKLIDMASQIESELGVELYPTLFFEYQNIDELSKYFTSEHQEAVNTFFATELTSVEADVSLYVDSESDHSAPPVFEQADTSSAERVSPSISSSQNRHGAVTHEDVAIIGMAGIFPDSIDTEEFWHHLVNKSDLIRDIPLDHFDYRPWYGSESSAEGLMYCSKGSFIKGVDTFDSEFFSVSPREAELMDPQLRKLLQVTYWTAESAGCIGRLKGSRTGVYVGVCFHDYQMEMMWSRKDVEVYDGIGNSATMLSNRPSFFFDLKGPSMTIDTACSSSLVALHVACQALKNGECDQAFVAGTNLLLSPTHYRYFSRLGALSHSGRSHTFDERADGYVPGEGVAAIMVKRLSDAQRDHDNIIGVVKGSSVMHGGYSSTITAPNVRGEVDTIKSAWESSGIDPATIGYIEAHGTGTKLGDPIEIQAVQKAFAESGVEASKCLIGSAKAHIGHLEGAAGIAGIIKVLLSMQYGLIPAMPKFEKLNSFINLNENLLAINSEPVEWHSVAGEGPYRAGVNSFGYGGTFAHVVLENYSASSEAPGPVANLAKPQESLVLVSAATQRQLTERVRDLLSYLGGAHDGGTLSIDVILEVLSSLLNLAPGVIEKEMRLRDCGCDFVQLDLLIERMQAQCGVDLAGGCSLDSTAEDIHKELSSRVEDTGLPSIDQIAYTTQACREHFSNRIAILAATTDELAESLHCYLQGEFKSGRVFSGETTSDAPLIKSLSDDKNLKGLAQEYIRTHQQLATVAVLWAGGMDFDWWESNKVRYKPVNLPLYPFSQNAYWYKPRRAALSDLVNIPENQQQRNTLDRVRDDYDALNGVMLNGLLCELNSMGIFNEDGQSAVAQTQIPDLIGMPDKYMRLLDDLIAKLLAGDYLSRDGDSLVITNTAKTEIGDMAQFDWREEAMQLSEASPDIKAYVDLSVSCLGALGEVLTGKVQATDVLFPNGSSHLVSGLYNHNVISDYFNDRLSNVVKQAVLDKSAALPADRKVRILEVGAGTGGTTLPILDALSDYHDQIEYVYTDVSGALMSEFRSKHSSVFNDMEFFLWDVNRPFQQQGIKHLNADIVIAANVLHATRNINTTLTNISELFAEDAFLIVSELTQNTLFFSLTFGLLDGWWTYEDGEDRIAGSPLLSETHWLSSFQSAGYDDAETACENTLGQNILIASHSGSKQRVNEVEPISPDSSATEVDGAVLGEDVGEVVDALSVYISEMLSKPVSEIDTRAYFLDLGVDSINGVAFLAGVNNKFSTAIEPVVLLNQPTIEKLAEYICELRSTAKGGTEDATAVAMGNPGKIQDRFDSDQALANKLKEEKSLKSKTEIDKLFSVTDHSDYNVDEIFRSLLGKDFITHDFVPTQGGLNIELFSAGTKGDVVLLLPPLNSLAIIWYKQFQALSKHHRVVSVHYPGFGNSEFEENGLDINKIGSLIVDALDNAGYGSTFHIVGWSMGGLIGQAIAERHKSLVKSLTLIGTGTISMFDDDYYNEHTHVRDVISQEIRSGKGVHQIFKDNEDVLIATFNTKVLMHYAQIIRDYDHKKVRDIDVPVLILNGEDDKVLLPQYAKALTDCIPGAFYKEINQGGHFLALTHAGKVNKQLSAMFDSTWRIDAAVS